MCHALSVYLRERDTFSIVQEKGWESEKVSKGEETLALPAGFDSGNVHQVASVYTYLLTPWNRALLQKLTICQLVKNFPHFMEPQRFITAFKSTHHPSLSWARSIQSVPVHLTPRRFTLILFSHALTVLPCVLLFLGNLNKTLYVLLLFPVIVACLYPPILIILITRIVLFGDGDSYFHEYIFQKQWGNLRALRSVLQYDPTEQNDPCYPLCYHLQ